MDAMGIILGVLMGINIILAIINKNWHALYGWFVVILEWSKRL